MLKSLQERDIRTLHKEFGNLTTEIILKESDQRANLFTLMKDSEADLDKVLKLLLIDLAKSVNVVRNLNREQIEELAMYIPEEFKSLKLEEVYIVMKRFKTGQVDLRDRLDVDTIMKEFRRYFDERCIKAAQINDQFHVANKALGSGKRSSDDVKTERDKNHQANLHFELNKVLKETKPNQE